MRAPRKVDWAHFYFLFSQIIFLPRINSASLFMTGWIVCTNGRGYSDTNARVFVAVGYLKREPDDREKKKPAKNRENKADCLIEKANNPAQSIPLNKILQNRKSAAPPTNRHFFDTRVELLLLSERHRTAAK